MAYDLHYPNRSLILRGNGGEGGTVFLDESNNPKVPALSGAVTTTTTFSKFGGGALNFAGGHLAYAIDSELMFPGDVTVELWLRHTISDNAGRVLVCLGNFDGIDNTAMLYVTNRQVEMYLQSGGSTSGISSGVTLTNGQWYHVEMSRTSGNWRLFLDGVLCGIVASAANIATGIVTIGNAAGMAPYLGQIDDLRISKGLAGNTVNFTPPIDEMELAPPEGYAQFLLNSPKWATGAAFGGHMALAWSKYSLSARLGAAVKISSPRQTLLADMSSSTTTVRVVSPGRSLVATFGARMRLSAPRAQLGMGVTVENGMLVDLVGPGMSISMLGTVMGSAQIDATAPNWAARFALGVRAEMRAPQATLGSSATAGVVLAFDLMSPRRTVELRILNSRNESLVMNLLAPGFGMLAPLHISVAAPRWSLQMTMVEVVALVRDCYVLNLRHDKPDALHELTRYTGYPFDKIIRLGVDYFGIGDDGIYLLGGDTDHATPDPVDIAWSWRTYLSDFGVAEKKSLPSVYFSGRLGRAMEVSIQVGETGDMVYRYKSQRDATAQNYREKLGRGLKARYFAIGAAGEGEFELDTMDFEVHQLSRRI